MLEIFVEYLFAFKNHNFSYGATTQTVNMKIYYVFSS